MRRLLAAALLALLLTPALALAAHVSLCTQTTGSSPCPLPTSAIRSVDTLEVLTGNVVNANQTVPNSSYPDSGLLVINTGGTLNLTGWSWLKVSWTGVLDNSGAIANDASIQLEDTGTFYNRAGATLTVTGEVDIYDSGQLVNDGTMTNSGYLYTLLYPANDPPGQPDHPLFVNHGTFTNLAGADIPNDGQVDNTGTFTVAPGALFSSTGLLTNSGLLTLAGSLEMNVYDPGGGRAINSGDFRVPAGGSITRGTATRPYGSYWQTAGRSTFNGGVGTALLYIMSGSLEGAATLASVVRVGDGISAPATLSPGDSVTAIGTLAVTGSLALGANAISVFDLRPGLVCDHVTTTANDTLGGELALRLPGGNSPAAGDTLVLFTTGGNVVGSFANVTVNGAPAGGSVSVLVEAKRVRVAVNSTASVPSTPAAPAGMRFAAMGLPANPGFRLDLPRAAHVRVALFDVHGRQRAMLFEGDAAAGSLPLPLRGRELEDGVFFARADVRDAENTHALSARIVRVR